MLILYIPPLLWFFGLYFLETFAIPFFIFAVPFYLYYSSIGLPVTNQQGGMDYWLPDPNMFGVILVVGSQMIVLYLLALLISVLGHKFKRKSNLPNL